MHQTTSLVLIVLSIVANCKAQRRPPNRRPPNGCPRPGQRDTTPPELISHVPFVGEIVVSNPFNLVAEVSDGQNDCVSRVQFELRDPNVRGSRTGFQRADREGQSHLYTLQHTFPYEGTWEFRVKMNDFADNVVNSSWKSFEVATNPVTPPTTSPVAPPTLAPTLAPVTPPTAGPTMPPTLAPVTPPTAAPNTPPTLAPVTPPTVAPTTPPTLAPVTPPTAAPTTPPTLAPVSPPTAAPTTPPTLAPVTPPTVAPTTPPTLAPEVPPTPQPSMAPTQDAQTIINAAKTDIENVIDSTQGLAAKLIRLAFHDCVGGCDGCVDLGNPDNAGLLVPIEALDPIVNSYENAASGVSRADIWALAALTAAERAQRRNDRIPFPMEWIGRENCAGGFDARIVGPDRQLPSPDQTSENVLHFFFDEFGFDDRQTTALFGAHSIGVLARENSGFDGPNGWDRNPDRLNNNYHRLLVGGNDPVNDSIETMVAAPNWNIREVDNVADDFFTPNRFQWERTENNVQIVSLNTDIALVRDLGIGNHLDESTGEVSCNFRGRRSCPHAARTIRIVSEYANDNDLFMNDFRDVFSLMLVHGYDASNPCEDALCVLGEII